MKEWYNNHIPLSGWKALGVWPIIFVRKGSKYDDVDRQHEEIHGRQQLEMLWIVFFVWYVAEWLIRLLLYWNFKEAYYNVSFEQEAYSAQTKKGYLEERKAYTWTKYLTKKYFKFS